MNADERQSMTREEHEEVKRLKREVVELRRANEILKNASAFSKPSSTDQSDAGGLY